jgi:hypothetical protein
MLFRWMPLFLAGSWAVLAQTVDPTAITYGNNILKVSEAEQVQYIQSALDRGEFDDTLTMLAVNRSSLALPMIEKKIEEILASTDPASCCTTNRVAPERFIDAAARTIDYAGNLEALKQIANLAARDDEKFGPYVPLTIHNAEERPGSNPFVLAYAGLEMSNPALERRIIAWAESQLPGETAFRKSQMQRFWAQAMLARYGGRMQAENGWSRDPLGMRLSPALAGAMHDEVLRSMTEEIINPKR